MANTLLLAGSSHLTTRLRPIVDSPQIKWRKSTPTLPRTLSLFNLRLTALLPSYSFKVKCAAKPPLTPVPKPKSDIHPKDPNPIWIALLSSFAKSAFTLVVFSAVLLMTNPLSAWAASGGRMGGRSSSSSSRSSSSRSYSGRSSSSSSSSSSYSGRSSSSSSGLSLTRTALGCLWGALSSASSLSSPSSSPSPYYSSSTYSSSYGSTSGSARTYEKDEEDSSKGDSAETNEEAEEGKAVVESDKEGSLKSDLAGTNEKAKEGNVVEESEKEVSSKSDLAGTNEKAKEGKAVKESDKEGSSQSDSAVTNEKAKEGKAAKESDKEGSISDSVETNEKAKEGEVVEESDKEGSSISDSMETNEKAKEGKDAAELGRRTLTDFIKIGLAILVVLALMGAYSKYCEHQTSVFKLQVGLLGMAKSLQSELDRIAETADTSNSEGLKYILTETTVALLRHPDYFISAYSSENVKKNGEEGEKLFNELSIEERGKFDEETLVNVNDKRIKQPISRTTDGFNNEYIVVTILVAAKGHHKFPTIKGSQDVKDALKMLGSILSSDIEAVEVMWTPQAENDTLSEQEYLEDYPQLKPLK